MAPQPEYDKEPKAPDKNVAENTCEDSKVPNNVIHDQQTNLDCKPANSAAKVETEDNKHVEALDDGQLRALLDEAITYKCPKDLENKSSLFKKLLGKVEQDEQACEAAAAREWGGCGGAGGGRGRVRGGRGRRALPHSNSLQDLVAALAAEPAVRRRHHPPAVSARTHHGGSLPSGVDTSFLLCEEPRGYRGGGSGSGSVGGSGGGVEYVATVHCENPAPLTERRVSASDAHSPNETEPLHRRSKMSSFPMTYTSRASLEIVSGAVGSGRAVTTPTASHQVDSGIPFSCISSPEVVASCTTASSISQAAVALDAKPLQLCSSYRAVSSLTGGEQSRDTSLSAQKSLDENGNSVPGFSSPLSGSSQHKKPRRKKTSKNETVIKSHQIDGYQGNKDLNEVLRFIESNEESGRGKLPRLKHHHEEERGKKRAPDRRKDKGPRASSLEERSRTTLEELTEPPAPRPAAAAAERRSWGDERCYYDSASTLKHDKKKAKPSKSVDLTPHEPHSDTAVELLDFQTVTKKKKQRKRFDEGGGGATAGGVGAGAGAGGGARHASPDRRRKSAPPSDKSNDSNDDMDSVHSLPSLSPSAPTPTAPRPPVLAPAPHASYADIARTRHNIPDLIESCNYYSEAGESAPPPPPPPPPAPPAPPAPLSAPTPTAAPIIDTESYPALETRTRTRAGGKAPPPLVVDAVATAVGVAPDVVSDRRPAVILAEQCAPRDMAGVTFGFAVNEQLLATPPQRRCDLLAAVPPYRPPPPPDHAASTAAADNLNKIVDFVGNAWEDIMKLGGGKVRYFSE